MKRSLLSSGLVWLWLSLVIIGLDFTTKLWVMNHMALGETRPLMPFINLHYAHNYGAAFSLLADKGGWQRWFFAGIALGVVVALLIFMGRNPARKINNVASALIIGGALGNLYDRAYHGWVVDFIDYYLGDWHFATFNVADSAICIGAALLLLEGLVNPANKKQRNQV